VEVAGDRVTGLPRRRLRAEGDWGKRGGVHHRARNCSRASHRTKVVFARTRLVPRGAARRADRSPRTRQDETFTDIGTRTRSARSLHSEKRPMPREAVFLDRDGTLIEAGSLPRRAGAGAADTRRGRCGCAPAQWTQGVLVIVVTNQAGVARGYFPRAASQSFTNSCPRCSRSGVRISTRSTTDRTTRRKVRARTASRASAASRSRGCCSPPRATSTFDLARSWMIGDKPCDAESGSRRGVPHDPRAHRPRQGFAGRGRRLDRGR